MTRHRYPTTALAGDYGRAIAGIALAATPLFLVSLNPYVATLFTLLLVLFLVFASRTLLRQFGPLAMTDEGIASCGPFAVELSWAALDELKLAYFATRRDGDGGWMQLALRAGRKRLRLDSRIEGFAAVVERATRAAIARHLTLSVTTTANLTALGVRMAELER
jgi:hypothetical protein